MKYMACFAAGAATAALLAGHPREAVLLMAGACCFAVLALLGEEG